MEEIVRSSELIRSSDFFEIIIEAENEFEEKDFLSHNAAIKHNGEVESGLRFLQNRIIEIASEGTPLLIVDNNEVKKLPADISSFLGIPLKIRDKVFGVLSVLTKPDGVPLNEKDLYYLNFMIQQASYMVENLFISKLKSCL